jgi:hypothetical protein
VGNYPPPFFIGAVMKEAVKQVKAKIEKEIEDKKIALYKLEGYILGLTNALAQIDVLEDLPEETKKIKK